jgi:hypothetical protein
MKGGFVGLVLVSAKGAGDFRTEISEKDWAWWAGSRSEYGFWRRVNLYARNGDMPGIIIWSDYQSLTASITVP